MINTFGAQTFFRAWNTRRVLVGTREMSCLEHKECPASNTRNVLLRTQRMFCFEHKECSASNTRNVLLRTHGMFCFEHKECLTVDSNTYLTVRFQWCPSLCKKIKIENRNFYTLEERPPFISVGFQFFVL